MNPLIQSFCLYLVIGIGLGIGLLITVWIYWMALEKIIMICGIKKDLIQFIWDKRRMKLRPKPKIQ